MATTEDVIGQLPNGNLIVYFTQTGPASYAAAGVPVTIAAFRKQVTHIISLENDGGYKVSAREAERNSALSSGGVLTFNIPVHYNAYACPVSGQTSVCATGFTVPTTTSLASTTFSGIVTGY